MNLWVLGTGKTGAMVSQVAEQRNHQVRSFSGAQNPKAEALTEEALADVDVVVDFTTPSAVLENISACARAGKNMVVGTTGWYSEMEYIQKLVARSGIGLVWGSNFSVGVNIFFAIAREAGKAGRLGYSVGIVERHHEQKKDAPSGTAVSLQQILEAGAGTQPEISSVRQGDTVGTHVILLDSPHDTMMLVHDAKSRAGFAEGAVRAAEWIRGKKGFFDFREIFPNLP